MAGRGRRDPDVADDTDAAAIGRRKTVPIISEGDLRALVKVCQGQELDARRDTALILVFLDTEVRLSELADLQFANVDLHRTGTLLVRGKGNRDRL